MINKNSCGQRLKPHFHIFACTFFHSLWLPGFNLKPGAGKNERNSWKCIQSRVFALCFIMRIKLNLFEWSCVGKKTRNGDESRNWFHENATPLYNLVYAVIFCLLHGIECE